MTTVGVSIPSIPPRAQLLARALTSVCRQSRPVNQISVYVDHDGIGAAEAKNAALGAVNTDWVAFLDDDDEFLPHHVAHLLAVAEDTKADLVYPWYQGINVGLFAIPDPTGNLVTPHGQPFTDEHAEWIMTNRNFIPVTVLARTELVKDVGGFVAVGDANVDTCDDMGLWQRMLKAGATFVHHPEVTWQWNGHGGHTSGRAWKDVAHYAGYKA